MEVNQLLYVKMLFFKESNFSDEFHRDLLETMNNFNFNVNHSNPQDQKLKFEFGKEMIFNIEQIGRKINREKSLAKLLKSPTILASGISTILVSSDLNELCDRSKFFLQEKQTGNISDTFNKEIVTLTEKLLKYKCISTKQFEIPLLKCLN